MQTSSQLSQGDRLDMALQIARAVRHMHQSKSPVVHGHLKPRCAQTHRHMSSSTLEYLKHCIGISGTAHRVLTHSS